jgi:hypothetical protein
VLASFAPGAEGAYTVAVANDFGTTVSAPAMISAPLNTAGRLTNLSIRAPAGNGTDALIVGFALGGNGTGGKKALLLRGAGPALSPFGVSGTLADPVLKLYDSAGALIDQNDDWTGVFDFASVGAFPFAGSSPKDAAIYDPYATAGSRSMVIAGKNGATGVALGEVYDATPEKAFTAFTPKLINISARAVVGSADNVLILGFAVGGQGSTRLLVRAVGPTLAQAPFAISGALSDPTLEIYDRTATLLAANDDWGTGGAGGDLGSAFAQVAAFPLSSVTSKDAALILTLPPGAYSAIVRGKGGAAGVALVELYELP